MTAINMSSRQPRPNTSNFRITFGISEELISLKICKVLTALQALHNKIGLPTQSRKDFCLKVNIPKGNYWILRINVMGRYQKVPKFDFQSQFSTSKIIRIFLNFFSLKNINLVAHFYWHSLITSILKSCYFLKWFLIFDTSPFLKIQ